MVRDGYLPVITPAKKLQEESLPAGAGALAGVCFIQSAGGKLREASGYLPLARALVEVFGVTGKFEARTDGDGYFVLALPSGEYTVRVAGLSYPVTIEQGKTSLVALRGGKRMVD